MGRRLNNFIEYWNNNIDKNTKRVSIALGGFLVFSLMALIIPFNIWIDGIVTLEWANALKTIYGGFTFFMSIFIYAVFGKDNGNGKIEETESETEMVQISMSDISDILLRLKELENKKIEIPTVTPS